MPRGGTVDSRVGVNDHFRTPGEWDEDYPATTIEATDGEVLPTWQADQGEIGKAEHGRGVIGFPEGGSEACPYLVPRWK